MWKKADEFIKKLDKMNWWYLGLVLVLGLFLPVFALGKGSVFEIHDQLDETLLTYVLGAKHLFDGTGIYPEILSGISASGMQPSAVLFVPLYRILPTFAAFVTQYIIVCLSAFYGMYLLVRKLTESSGLALVAGTLFCMLPNYPVYGLSVVGVPLLVLCFWQLLEGKHIVPSLLGVLYFGLTTHLVLIGYVALFYLSVGGVCLLIRHRGIKQQDYWYYGGTLLLLGIYCVVNFAMFMQLIVGTGDFVSHREELVNNTAGIQTWTVIRDYFTSSGQHVPTCQKYMMLPMGAITILQGIRYKRLSSNGKRNWKLLVLLWGIAVLTAVAAGVFRSAPFMAWKNKQTGFFHYFQPERFYWVYSALWMLAFVVSLSLIWKEFDKCHALVKLAILALLLIPTADLVLKNSTFYMNVNQYNNGSGITGYQTWEDFYMEDVLTQVDAYIGQDKTTYRIAHLGVCPAPSLLYGFYTVDGYSNNYALNYKHSFREIMAAELDKNFDNKIYFDTWGSRCYLFAAESGRNWYIQKKQNFKYTNLKLDTAKMAELGCSYLFSAAEIENADEIGLVFEGCFDTEESVYEIWLYRIAEE